FVVEPHLDAGVATDLEPAEDARQLVVDLRAPADLRGHARFVWFVARRFDDHLVGTAGEAEASGRGADAAEVAAIEIDDGAGRLRVDLDDGDLRRHAFERGLDGRDDLLIGLAAERIDVVAIRLGELAELLVRASDV